MRVINSGNVANDESSYGLVVLESERIKETD